jgi:signal transduction histidine kinase
MRKSIVSRISKSMRLLLLSGIILLGVFFMYFSKRYLQGDRIDTLKSCAVNAQAAYNESLLSDNDLDPDFRRSKLRENLRLITNTTSTKMLLADETGRILVCTETDRCEHEGEYVPTDVLANVTAYDDAVEIKTNFANMYKENYYTVAMAARNESNEIVGYVFSFADSERTTAFISALTSIFTLSAAIMMLLSGIISNMLTNRLTTPLLKLTNAAQKFSNGDFSARVSVDGEDELAKLARTFNEMASFVEKNEKSRSEFVANVAHELRTPMTSIKGFVDGIRDGTIPFESQGKYLDVISDEVSRLTRLINSMMDMSKLESGEFNIDAQNYNIWQTIASIVFSFEARIEEKNIKLLGFQPSKVMVNADKDLIYQVTYNLIDNAIKFTPREGYIAFSVTETGNYVTVKIKNSGRGIDDNILPYIFDRFYKADHSRNLNVRGAGIGLYISKVLVQRSGGNIYCESVKGEYTEFIFTLPAAKSVKKTRSEKNIEKTGELDFEVK